MSEVQIWMNSGLMWSPIDPGKIAWLDSLDGLFTGTQEDIVRHLNAQAGVEIWQPCGDGVSQVHEVCFSTLEEAMTKFGAFNAAGTTVCVSNDGIDVETRKRAVDAMRTPQKGIQVGDFWLKYSREKFVITRASRKPRRKSKKRHKLTTFSLLNAIYMELRSAFGVWMEKKWTVERLEEVSEIYIKLTSRKRYFQQFGYAIRNLASVVEEFGDEVPDNLKGVGTIKHTRDANHNCIVEDASRDLILWVRKTDAAMRRARCSIRRKRKGLDPDLTEQYRAAGIIK